jgi:hypothetical protein
LMGNQRDDARFAPALGTPQKRPHCSMNVGAGVSLKNI